jgi:hypothetical protein
MSGLGPAEVGTPGAGRVPEGAAAASGTGDGCGISVPVPLESRGDSAGWALAPVGTQARAAKARATMTAGARTNSTAVFGVVVEAHILRGVIMNQQLYPPDSVLAAPELLFHGLGPRRTVYSSAGPTGRMGHFCPDALEGAKLYFRPGSDGVFYSGNALRVRVYFQPLPGGKGLDLSSLTIRRGEDA